jgi:hypothetical protein
MRLISCLHQPWDRNPDRDQDEHPAACVLRQVQGRHRCVLDVLPLRTFTDCLSSEGIYQRFEQEGDEVSKLKLAKPELEVFILNTISKALGPAKAAGLDRSVDLFAFGVDSLQGTRIRNVCQKELFLAGQTLGQNGEAFDFGFGSTAHVVSVLQSSMNIRRSKSTSTLEVGPAGAYCSVYRLADYILSLQAGGGRETDQYEAQMTAMVDKFLANVGTHAPAPGAAKRPENARVIVCSFFFLPLHAFEFALGAYGSVWIPWCAYSASAHIVVVCTQGHLPVTRKVARGVRPAHRRVDEGAKTPTAGRETRFICLQRECTPTRPDGERIQFNPRRGDRCDSCASRSTTSGMSRSLHPTRTRGQ